MLSAEIFTQHGKCYEIMKSVNNGGPEQPVLGFYAQTYLGFSGTCHETLFQMSKFVCE